MRPVIGITSDHNGGDRPEFGGKEETIFIRARYLNAIEKMGGVPFVLGPIRPPKKIIAGLLDRIDGLLLTGSGPDIDPKLYGEPQKFKFKLISEKRSAFEWALAEAAMRREMPILGICGGMQLLNVMGGGTLYQDIQREKKNPLHHDSGPQPCHPVEIRRQTLLAKIIQHKIITVNSSHHQGIKKLAIDYGVNAESPDGLIEGIEHPGTPFIVGIQWHPEYLHEDDSSREIFKAFLKAARQYRKGRNPEVIEF